MARTYKRDGSGRFAGGGGGSSGGGSKRPAVKTVSRGVNRLTRDNAGKITSVGGEGATARGGRLKTAAGNKRAMQTAKVSGGSRAGTIKGKVKRDPGAMSKVGRQPAKPAAAAPKPATTAKNRASQMRERAAQLDQRGNALMGGGRRDTAVVNLSLNSRARRNETNAGFKGLEMTRNAERLRDKADRIEYRSNQSRAKKLRSVHETPIAKAFAKKAGKSVTEVRAAIRSMTPEKQIKMFKQYVKENRSAAKPAATKGARLGGTRRTTQAAAPKNTTPNKTGQSKTLNRFNSRPVGTMVAGKGINLVPSTKRVPLQVQRKESDLAFARVATKAARKRAAAPAKAQQKQTTAQRTARAAANQKRITQSVLAKGGKRPSPSRKQRRSIMTAEAAKRFYATGAVNTLNVNVKKPGFRLPRAKR